MKLTLLFLMCLSCCFSLAHAQEENDTSDPKEYSRAGAFAEANAGAADLLTGLVAGDISPQEFGEALLPMAEEFYVSGYISLQQSKDKIEEIRACMDVETQYRAATGSLRDSLRQQRNTKCGAAVNFQTLSSNVPACIQPGSLLAGAQCCGNAVLGASLTLEGTLTGKKSGETCAEHSECRSKICNKDDETPAGTCAPVLTCMTSAPLNAECSLENPNCQSGVCRQQDFGLEGVQCKAASVACTQASDCCSNKCISNKCEDKYICTDCVGEGVKPSGGKRCCAGLFQPSSGEACRLEFPPFVLPNIPAKTTFWRTLMNALIPVAHAQTNELEEPKPKDPPANFKPTPVTNDTGLTRAQLDLIEEAVKDCLPKKLADRKTCLLNTYNMRKQYLSENNAARKQGQKLSATFTPEEYVKRYNIPAIAPKNRSDVNSCRFNSAKDNWIDASNLQRNGELFLRAFEVSYSGKGTQDFWHLPNASGAYHKDNIYTRTKTVQKMLRDNRNIQKDQTNYLDLMMSCQCLYTFGPDKFDAEQQTFFFQFCTGAPANKICRAGTMQDSLKLPDSPEAAYREGKEFPNYVEMYLANLQSGKLQSSKTDLKGLDSSAAGINHEEVLVRWLRMRSCNQVDVFVDTEKVDTELQGLVDDLTRARKPVPALTKYWDNRLKEMADAKVDKKIVEFYKNDNEKDLLYRGYVDTESKIGSYKKKVPKFLLFIFLAVLGALAVVAVGIAGAIGVAALGVGTMLMGGGGGAGAPVLDKLIKDMPTPLIETRLVQKKSCMLGLFWCKTYYRILHYPAYTNGKSLENAFPFVKKEERTCEETGNRAAGLVGTAPNSCSGMFKGTMCARTFYRPVADAAIKDKAEFAPWAQIMNDKMIMDPVFPEFFSTDGMSFDFRWKDDFNTAFQSGCSKIKGQKTAKADDKLKFLPNMDTYFDGNYVFKRPFQMHQDRINAYKEAVKRYALCKNLKDCGAVLYDGEHPNPRGFLDIVEDEEQAELFANYVYQIHFKWRHMSSNTGIGYPLAYLENYYQALQYNVRLLTTLSIRRGIEFDEAYNKYAEDLAIRRDNYQDTGRTYGVTLGEDPKTRVQLNSFFRDLRSFGIPLISDFGAVSSGTSIREQDSVTGGKTNKAVLDSGSTAALNAARRLGARIENDKINAAKFAAATKGNADAVRRTASASKAMGAVNSPTSMMPSFANKSDSSNYSGIGGELGKGTLVASAAKSSDIGAVDTSNRGEGGLGSLMRSGGLSSGNGSDGSNDGFGAGNGNGQGAGSGSDSDKELDDAARLTGMNAGEVKGMLEGSEADRRKLQGSENDSLFDKVSKAYMRNLDRVLIRRKGPEAPAAIDKKAAPADKEKEEIKKIFNQ